MRTRPLAALAVTTAIGVVLAVAVVTAPGWPRVQETFFDPRRAWDSLPAVADGMLLNLGVLAAVAPVTVIGGLALALLRTSRTPWLLLPRLLAVGYVDFFRGTPIYVTLLVIGFGIPSLLIPGVPNDPVVLGVGALSLTYIAYVGEVIRGGIEAADPSLSEAASLDGATHWQTTRMIVLPQVWRSQYPALLNDFVALQKDCGLISVLGAIDAVRAARIESAEYFTFTPYIVAALLFIALAVPTGRAADWAARRVR